MPGFQRAERVAQQSQPIRVGGLVGGGESIDRLGQGALTRGQLITFAQNNGAVVVAAGEFAVEPPGFGIVAGFGSSQLAIALARGSRQIAAHKHGDGSRGTAQSQHRPPQSRPATNQQRGYSDHQQHCGELEPGQAHPAIVHQPPGGDGIGFIHARFAGAEEARQREIGRVQEQQERDGNSHSAKPANRRECRE